MFYVWNTERRPPTRQHNNTLDSWDKTALQCLTESLLMCCLCVALPQHDLCHTTCTLSSSSPDAPLNIDGIGPYVAYSPPMVGMIPMLIVAAATPDDHL